ncbi:PIG-L family deacetylase [Rubrivirga sp. S365]|uniref:PIG-L family deacetylase n=1 Tax=Rubrivirga litoralis TaxID=3075598 RepID=A0ABU3BLR5_9BACT|nr:MULTISPECIES: PIG-L family deacetylase [unclassified Rubrivirga]MDT0630228.1 PIG-L family deacetylase [Rubrivirga sp. F394]MDT7855739.1 PIG-L family deacetylase [Rubrivirga sp. S365]
MTLLYVFPHPDDESFGPAPAIARQVREGHDVALLTLTKGGATKVRHDLGLSVEEMGARREQETQCAADALGADLTVLDFPDGGLQDLDPRDLEHVIERKIEAVRPDVVVTYDYHGNSVHPDHVVTHAVVKRAYEAACDEMAGRSPRRLAFFTLVQGEVADNPAGLRGSPRERVGAVVTFADEDRQTAEAALACYETYAAVVEAHQPLRQVEDGVAFVLFQEEHDEPLGSLTDDLHDEG